MIYKINHPTPPPPFLCFTAGAFTVQWTDNNALSADGIERQDGSPAPIRAEMP